MNTEAKAKELWCPMVRFVVDSDAGSATFNRGGLPSDPLNDHSNNDGALCNCIASQCAMWRWTPPPPHPCDEAPKFGYMERGYCGLAGNPGSTA